VKGVLMLINEKMRFMRQQKGWTQEEMAYRLSMSANGYGNIERGYTNLSLTKLKKIAALFDKNLDELFGSDDQNIFNSIGDNNTGVQANQNFCSQVSDPNQCARNIQVDTNLEKQILINAQQSAEIKLLRQINALLIEKVARNNPEQGV
jgi:transcriptional regulator with XRE-family HTH domain